MTVTSLPTESLLVALDVSSLYSNIPHKEGITACEESLNLRESQVPPLLSYANLFGSFYQWTHSILTVCIIHKHTVWPWAPVWPLPTRICSWESWNRSSCRPRINDLKCGGGILMTSLPYGLIEPSFNTIWTITTQQLNSLLTGQQKKSALWTQGFT